VRGDADCDERAGGDPTRPVEVNITRVQTPTTDLGRRYVPCNIAALRIEAIQIDVGQA
jgi:murein L,D-transpeptidase YcbB/YkuD